MRDLSSKMHRLCDDKPYDVGWYLKDLATGEVADRHGDVVVTSASTRKIAIMMTALKMVNEGHLSLDQPVTIEARYQDNNSGTFQHLRPGFTITLQDVLTMMIIVSDNTCTGTVADMVGLDRINDLCRGIGMVGTTHRHGTGTPRGGYSTPLSVEETNATTPRDLGLLLDTILKGTEDVETASRLGCTPDLCERGMTILRRQRLQTRLPFLLPHGARVAHKTGTGRSNVNDAGIVYSHQGNPLFILTVLTDGVPVGDLCDGIPGFASAQRLISRLARLCYDSLSQ